MSNNDLKVLGLEGTEQLVEEIKSLVAASGGSGGNEDTPTASVTAVSVTESADGTVTMINTLDNGETETIAISPDIYGNPNKLTYNGIEIPITWNSEGGSSSGQTACIVGAFNYLKNYQTLAMASPCDPIVGEYEVTT